jgi:hypothetical protein
MGGSATAQRRGGAASVLKNTGKVVDQMKKIFKTLIP